MDIILRLPCVLHRTNYTRRSDCTESYGKITGLNPAIILLSLSVWGALMGIVGMIIALPCTSLMLSYYQRYIRIKEKEFSGGIEHTDFQHKENSNENNSKNQVIYLHISSKRLPLHSQFGRIAITKD